jgi:hypothetical protein
VRQTWMAICLSVAAGVCLPGCTTTQPELKPNLPEEYVLPPESDARFSAPHSFPKETLNTGPVRRFTNPMQQPGAGGPRGPGRVGGATGFGGH